MLSPRLDSAANRRRGTDTVFRIMPRAGPGMSNALVECYHTNVTDHAEESFVLSPDGIVSFAHLKVEVERMLRELRALECERVGLIVRPDCLIASIAALIALSELAADAFLLGPDQSESQREGWADELALAAVVDGARQPGVMLTKRRATGPRGDGAVVILTSGTAGKPKAVRHTWATLMRPARVDAGFRGTRWLSSYPIQLYAGLQVFAQCFANASALAVVSANRSAAETVSLLINWNIEYACGTPSFWRHLLMFAGEKLKNLAGLRQITMGGEVAPQDVLERLKRTLPNARIVHIYATTELGRCFSVTDGEAGFPSRYLDQPSADGISLMVKDGQLYVRSQNAMVGYDIRSGATADAGDWFATGDLVDVQGDRVYFVGRSSDLINVGGHKVYPLEVEQFIRSLPFIRDVRVYGMKSSIVGELVACDVVFTEGHDPIETKRALARACADHLMEHQRPRRIEILNVIQMSSAGKTKRGIAQ